MAVGFAKRNELFFSKAAGINNPVSYVGAKTGKDGIHGATMASAEFDDNSKQKKPTVQVGDPFIEKLLIEACLEVINEKGFVGLQDLGAAGLTSSTVEAADRSKKGIILDLDKVKLRDNTMTPYEIMLSESQERMIVVCKPESAKSIINIIEKWDIDWIL